MHYTQSDPDTPLTMWSIPPFDEKKCSAEDYVSDVANNLYWVIKSLDIKISTIGNSIYIKFPANKNVLGLNGDFFIRSSEGVVIIRPLFLTCAEVCILFVYEDEKLEFYTKTGILHN